MGANSKRGRSRRHLAIGLVAISMVFASCVGARQTASSPPVSPASPASLAANASGTATQVDDCCALGTKRPYALVTARPTIAGSRKPAATRNVPAASGSVTVSPKFDEQAVDSNQDGLIDELILTPTITVPTAGKYVVGAMLFSQSGVQVISAGPGEIPLVAGSQPLPLEFGGTYIYKSGQWGPYTPVMTVSYEGAVTTTLVLTDAALDPTQAYDYMQFLHDRTAVDLKSMSSKPVDTNGDGMYDELDITGIVTVETPGLYEINSGLYGREPFGQVAAVYMTRQLAVGANPFTLAYKGSEIAKSGVDGPYTLFELEVYLDADPADAPDPVHLNYTTPPYKASQFNR
jgi:hypothetical protein